MRKKAQVLAWITLWKDDILLPKSLAVSLLIEFWIITTDIDYNTLIRMKKDKLADNINHLLIVIEESTIIPCSIISTTDMYTCLLYTSDAADDLLTV